jgi:hypothetical protein
LEVVELERKKTKKEVEDTDLVSFLLFNKLTIEDQSSEKKLCYCSRMERIKVILP